MAQRYVFIVLCMYVFSLNELVAHALYCCIPPPNYYFPQSIGLSFIQLISLLVTFPVAWPSIFTAIFQVGGAITVLGQHLVNLKCMIPNYNDADVFYGIGLTWGVAPPLLLLACVVTWHIVDKLMPCFTVSDLDIKIKTSCVALLYLLWPSLCSQTFQLFACRSVCDDNVSYLRADLDEVCWKDRHLHYSLALGMPMLFGYVIGLPLLAYLKIRRMNEERKLTGHDAGFDILPEDHKIFGAFYSAFKIEVWWWEGTVAARKIVIAMIGVFGAELESMQVHMTSMLVVCIIVATSQVRPFGGLSDGLLHWLEMFSLMATFLTLWAGSVFNTLPRCEDPDNVGEQLFWCEAMSVMVGMIDILVVVAFVLCFVYLKVTTGGGGIELTAGTSNPLFKLLPKNKKKLSKKKKKKKKKKIAHRLVATQTNVDSNSQLEATSEVKIEIENDQNVTEHTDDATGRMYSYNSTTKETKWLDDDANKVILNTNQEVAEEEELGIGIEMDEHGRRYACNRMTGETAWLDDENGNEILTD